MLEHCFAELGDSSDLTLMIAKYATAGKGYDQAMARVVRSVTLHHERDADRTNTYEIIPAPVAELRKTLFAKLDDLREGRLANLCLLAIDALRDEYGSAPADPRHPDVTSTQPWPVHA